MSYSNKVIIILAGVAIQVCLLLMGAMLGGLGHGSDWFGLLAGPPYCFLFFWPLLFYLSIWKSKSLVRWIIVLALIFADFSLYLTPAGYLGDNPGSNYTLNKAVEAGRALLPVAVFALAVFIGAQILLIKICFSKAKQIRPLQQNVAGDERGAS